MARLSGLPSEHHHEGPGDAPRRKRGRPNKGHASSQSQSQEASSTGKRTASPTAESSQTKRTKRTQIDEADQIIEEVDELEQTVSGAQESDTIHLETRRTTTTTRRHNRRHSEPLVSVEEEEAVDDVTATPLPSTQPPSGLTPHLNRIGAVRRDLATTRRARMSTPAQLHVERVDDEVDGTQFQYAPLSAVLDSRTRRRLRRSHLSQEVNQIEDNQKQDKKMLLELREQLRKQDAKIKDLEYQLEARRLGEIDMSEDHAEELEQQLDQARQEIDALRASSLYNGSDHGLSTLDGAADMSEDEDTHDQLMLVDPDDLHLSRDIDMPYTPDGKYASRVKELSSQMTFESLPQLSQLTHDTLMEEDDDVVPDKIQDQAVERYERELQHYIHILAQSQGALRVLTLELQNLHFLERGHSSNDIITDLRHGFDTLRTEVEKLFPKSTDNLTNQQLLQKIPELFSGIFFELKEKLAQLSAAQKTEVLLRRQYEGVLDLLAESEERVQELEQKSYALDKSNEEKQRTIIDFEEQVNTLRDQVNDQDAQLKDKDAQIRGLQDEREDQETALGRLREALETYRKDLDQVTQTATDFEAEHHETIARMEEEHAEAIQSLQADLAAEQDSREAAEGEILQKDNIIDELEGRIESIGADVDAMTGEMAELRERLKEQTDARGAAESQRDEQAEIANEYYTTIEALEENIADLKAQLQEAQTNLGAERAQREQTEAALDEANEKIEALNGRIHDEGITANELRSKLFQLQQEKEATIVQLQEEAQDREDDLNDLLTAESQARETAEKTVAKLDKQIETLSANLEASDIDLNNMTRARDLLEKDREQQAAALNQQLAELRAKYTALETSTDSTITSLQANITDLNNQVQRQQVEIKHLTEELANKNAQYEQDTSNLENEIVELKAELADERAENEKSHKEIDSLSQRIDTEARELLLIEDMRSKEINSLKTAINTHESTIKNLQDNAAQRADEHKERIMDLNREIEEMQMLGTARAETITVLQSQIEDLKKRFTKQEEDTRVTIDALNLAHRRLLEENEALAEALKKRNADNLKHIMDMKAANVSVKAQGVDLHRVQNGKVVKTAEKVKVGKKGSKKKISTRSWRDSAMGLDEDEAGSSKLNGEDEVDDDFLAA